MDDDETNDEKKQNTGDAHHDVHDVGRLEGDKFVAFVNRGRAIGFVETVSAVDDSVANFLLFQAEILFRTAQPLGRTPTAIFSQTVHLVLTTDAVFDAVTHAVRGEAGAAERAGESLIAFAGATKRFGDGRLGHFVAFPEASEFVGTVGAVVDAVASESRVDAVAVVAPKRRRHVALFHHLVVLAAELAAHVEYQSFAATPRSVTAVLLPRDGEQLAIFASSPEAVQTGVGRVAQEFAVFLVESVETVGSAVANVAQGNAFFETPEAIQTAPTAIFAGAVCFITAV